MASSPTTPASQSGPLDEQFADMRDSLTLLSSRFDQMMTSFTTLQTGFATMQSQIDSLQPHGPGKAPVHSSFGSPFGLPSSSTSFGGGPHFPPNPPPGFPRPTAPESHFHDI
ncbi:hypothetical protein O6H91_Y573400 [Diphasiastrum complanatum]|nr:hypothetical protein O6H91_Y573400 [Diphasiastrum complanatum]